MFFGGFECVRVWRRGWRRGEGGREREEEEGETFFFSTLEHQREAETQKTNLLFLSLSPSPFPYRARAADPDVLGDDLASLCFEKVGFTKKRGKEKKRFELEKSRERNLGHRRKKRLAVGPERKKKKVSSNSQKKKKKKKTASVSLSHRVSHSNALLSSATPRSPIACTVDIKTHASPGALSFAKGGTRCK